MPMAITCSPPLSRATPIADLIASGDKQHVLPLGSYQGIPVVTARQAVEHIARLAS